MTNLDPELRQLLDKLVRLRKALLGDRWKRFKRLDPFQECLFERTGKSDFLAVKNVTIHDLTVINGDVSIGEGTFVGQFCTLNGGGQLTIGKHCSIAAGARIFTHDTAKWAVSGGRAEAECDTVTIGDYCYIGANSVVTRGVEIGSHSVVAAGAVVTSSFPERSIIAGVPARRIGEVVLDDSSRPVFKYD